MAKKKRTYDEVATAKGRAERFLRNVLVDDERADEVENESVEEYAERKHILIKNPNNNYGVNKMTVKTETVENDRLDALEERVDEIEAENVELREKNLSLQNALVGVRNAIDEDLEDDDE